MAEKEKISTLAHGVIGGLVDTFYHSLDEKMRLTIPSEWQDAMGACEYVYIFPDASEECLDLVPVREMEAMLTKLQSAALFDPEADAARQALAEHAQMLKVDSHRRIRINDELLSFAGISQKVTLIGAFRKGKLWATEKKPPCKKIDVSSFRATMAKWKF